MHEFLVAQGLSPSKHVKGMLTGNIVVSSEKVQLRITRTFLNVSQGLGLLC